MKNIFSKLAIGIFIVASSISVGAETSTREYMILREKTIDALHAKYSDHENERLNLTANKLLHSTQMILQRLVGPVNIKGFPSNGKGVLGSRDDDQYDGLDGVALTSSDDKTRLFVTTVPIAQTWLAAHRKDVGRYSNLSELVGTADFYNATSTISGDATVYAYGAIPVAATGGLVARAIIFALGQDDPAPNPPQYLAVTVMSDTRIYILSEAIAPPKIPECKSSSQQDTIIFEQCFAKRISSKSEYSRLVDQAQRLVDRVYQGQQH